jgi:Zn-finger nucleic acid-binding protein
MKCPGCGEEMLVLELTGVEIDYCECCGGIWLDAGELEILLGDSAAELMAEFKREKRSKERKIKCPACGRKLEKVVCGETHLDQCRRGHGIWFDQGELTEIIAYDDMNSDVLRFLEDMFRETIKQEGE